MVKGCGGRECPDYLHFRRAMRPPANISASTPASALRLAKRARAAYGARMITQPPRIVRPIAPRLAACGLALALLTGAPVVHAAAPAAPVAAAPAPVAAAPAADPAIIKLPLQPVVPAAQRSCAAKTTSGLGYTALKAGDGNKPTAEDVVLVNYIGYLAATGQVFDQNVQTPFPAGNVIPGFSEGLQLMGRGSIQRLCIPAALGYGAKGAGAEIPPNSDLVFQVELLDFKSRAELAEMRRQQEAAQTAQAAAEAAAAAKPAQPATAPSPTPAKPVEKPKSPKN